VNTRTLTAALAIGLAVTAPALAAPEKTVVGPTITVGSTQPPPETPAAARHEAVAALAQARQACRQEADRESRRACLAAAREDHDKLMAIANGSGT
jgi:hypothetical protein